MQKLFKDFFVVNTRKRKYKDVYKRQEEQLSGSCTVEIAAFNEFSDFITDKTKEKEYDYIIFDTAPTGHTILAPLGKLLHECKQRSE